MAADTEKLLILDKKIARRYTWVQEAVAKLDVLRFALEQAPEGFSNQLAQMGPRKGYPGWPVLRPQRGYRSREMHIQPKQDGCLTGNFKIVWPVGLGDVVITHATPDGYSFSEGYGPGSLHAPGQDILQLAVMPQGPHEYIGKSANFAFGIALSLLPEVSSGKDQPNHIAEVEL